MVEHHADTVKASGSNPGYPTHGRDANGRRSVLQTESLGSTPTLSTNSVCLGFKAGTS